MDHIQKRLIKMKRIVLAILVMVLIYGCASASVDVEEDTVVEEEPEETVMEEEEEMAEEVPTTEEVSVDAETEASPPLKEFEMIAKQWSFEPETIEVDKGDVVKLKITSIDVAHGIYLGEFNVNERLEPNEEVIIHFLADKEGEFPFYCNVGCGAGHSNMDGTLVVR
jgi:cytochrome c oxidase subunit 2